MRQMMLASSHYYYALLAPRIRAQSCRESFTLVQFCISHSSPRSRNFRYLKKTAPQTHRPKLFFFKSLSHDWLIDNGSQDALSINKTIVVKVSKQPKSIIQRPCPSGRLSGYSTYDQNFDMAVVAKTPLQWSRRVYHRCLSARPRRVITKSVH